jgi:PAS domain S-box-containing protein
MHTLKSLNVFKSGVMLFIATFILLSLLPFTFWKSSITPLYINILVPLMSFLVSLLMIYTTWWSYKNNKKLFNAWVMISTGTILYFIANMFYFFLRDYWGLISPPSFVDILFLVSYPLLILGIFNFLKKPYKTRLKPFLDVVIVMVSLFFIVWFPLIWPVIKPSQPDSLSMILSISYLFLDLIFLLGVTVVLFSENKKINELPIVLLALGIFLQVFGDMVYAYHVVVPNLEYLLLADILYSSTSIFAILAIISYLKNININIRDFLSIYRKPRLYNDWISYLPLVLVLFTYSLLIVTTPDAALIWGVGIIVALVIFRQVITLNEIRKAQITLKRNKEIISKRKAQLDFITSNMLDLISESDENGVFKYVSPSSKQLLGYLSEDLLGKSMFEFIHPDDSEKVIESLKESQESAEGVRIQYRYRNAEGKYIWLETTGKTVFDEKGFRGFIYSSRDISDQKEAAEFVKKSLREKDALLREIHHRVNNNLQVISSLLSLQSDNVVDERDHELFIESQNRVRSMAMIHEKLYQSDSFSSINFSDYLKTLLNSLIYDYSNDLGHIEMELDIDDVDLNIETSVPCGLIINELVSNSLKHAFPHGRKGKIMVKLHQDNDQYVLIVGDDGIGYSEESFTENGKKLGFNLVKSLVKQLDGSMEILEGNGTIYKIIFSELKYQKRF